MSVSNAARRKFAWLPSGLQDFKILSFSRLELSKNRTQWAENEGKTVPIRRLDQLGDHGLEAAREDEGVRLTRGVRPVGGRLLVRCLRERDDSLGKI